LGGGRAREKGWDERERGSGSLGVARVELSPKSPIVTEDSSSKEEGKYGEWLFSRREAGLSQASRRIGHAGGVSTLEFGG